MVILVVEDEPSVQKMERLYLERAGYEVVEADSCSAALQRLRDYRPDLVLLDRSLPDGDGKGVCETIRQDSMVPVIMATAKVEEADELKGLGAGADDYLKKPFSPAVLLAHVESVLRRSGRGQIRFGSLHIDPVRQLVIDEGRELHLSTIQFHILLLLASYPGKVFTRSEILVGLNADGEVFDRTVDAHIKSIRKQFERKQYIRTIYGGGYVFRPATEKKSHVVS